LLAAAGTTRTCICHTLTLFQAQQLATLQEDMVGHDAMLRPVVPRSA
jgi:hypothetical protein